MKRPGATPRQSKKRKTHSIDLMGLLVRATSGGATHYGERARDRAPADVQEQCIEAAKDKRDRRRNRNLALGLGR